jgi:hypothetical protein
MVNKTTKCEDIWSLYPQGIPVETVAEYIDSEDICLL